MHQLLEIFLAATGSFAAITIFFFFAFLLCQCKYTTPRARPRSLSQPTAATELSGIEAGESASFDPALEKVSMSELILATNNFDPKLIIGDGSFGLVYKATLSNGLTVAVKKLSPDAFQGVREFLAEVETLGKLRHKNIVKILGYCDSGRDRVLIYEFIEKGSLDQWLQDTSAAPPAAEEEEEEEVRFPLSWRIRVRIVKGVANGLAFMHGLETRIVHRDIKPSNVLLDRDFEAHIADFGLARRIEGAHSHVSTQAAGTMGYMPPEYRAGYTAATVQADIYSFGVLMFEVATGKRPNWSVNEDGHEIWMLEWAKLRISENKYLEVIDPSIPGDELRNHEVAEFLRIADLCTSEKPHHRPLMRQVVEMLSHIPH